MSKLQNKSAKGRRLVNIAKKIFEAQGAFVEVAPNSAKWIRDKKTGKTIVVAVKKDYFTLFDLLVVWPGVSTIFSNAAYSGGFIEPRTQTTVNFFHNYGKRSLVQVTVLEAISRKREKIIASGFPAVSGDMILGWKGGRDPYFKVFRGPDFQRADEMVLKPIAAKGK